ncbi:hypothetical protein [Streptomyces sp. NPDC088727]|uniref:hypothetical protein n=1 Tax=Streptomyces sp. NPDC088727 TaxID=3365875 RepID=UPI00380AD9B5
MTDISATSFFRQITAAVEPDFEHEEIDTGGTKRPTKIHLRAVDPDSGDRMGTLTYHVPRRKADKILIEHLGTEDGHRRKGVGSALMDEMQRRHPGTPIDHGDRTDAGKKWWEGYSDGKKVTRGRTMALATTASTERPEWADGDFTAKTGHTYHTVTEPKAVTMRTPEGRMAGYVNWGDDGVIGNMNVREQHQRRGIATELLRRAREQRPDLQHSDRLSHDAQAWLKGIGERTAAAETPVPNNAKPYEHEHPWLPRDHFFEPTKPGLDKRLFDGDRMHPEVRQYLLSLLNSFWAPKYGDSWQTWARVYLAGSEASHFLGDDGNGNNDLDILIGIDYDAARHHIDTFTGEPDGALDKKLTDELREGLNDDARMLPGPDGKETGPWESTFYANPGSWDIRQIKPYAAYDITRDEWAVRPVETPADFGPEKLPESTWDVFDALQKLIKAVSELPEGVQEREGAALYDYLHGDRHAAFGPDGTGLYDPANATWKALDKAPGKPLQQLIDWKHAHDGASAENQENAA